VSRPFAQSSRQRAEAARGLDRSVVLAGIRTAQAVAQPLRGSGRVLGRGPSLRLASTCSIAS
jgi:hypothetical protein